MSVVTLCGDRLSQVVQPQNGPLWKGGQAADDVVWGDYCSGSICQRCRQRSLIRLEGEVRAARCGSTRAEVHVHKLPYYS